MAHVDEQLLLTRAHLAFEATAIGEALLDCDFEEARFRCHLLRAYAGEHEFEAVAEGAVDVLAHLPPGAPPRAGIGRALLRLTDVIDDAG